MTSSRSVPRGQRRKPSTCAFRLGLGSIRVSTDIGLRAFGLQPPRGIRKKAAPISLIRHFVIILCADETPSELGASFLISVSVLF